MPEKEVQKQSEKNVGMKLAGDGAPEERGTGRGTGRAKTPTGPSGRLTDEERKERHEWINKCMEGGKSESECVKEWEKQHG